MKARFIPLIGTLLLASACTLEANLNDLSGGKMPEIPPGIDLPLSPLPDISTNPSLADFAKSDIYVGSHGQADLTPLKFIIRMMNSDGTVVPGIVPEYSIISGTSVQKGDCTETDRFGISFCSLGSSEPGVKNIQLTNAKDHRPTKGLVFNALSNQETSIGDGSGGDGALESGTSKGWKFKGTVGAPKLNQKYSNKGYLFSLDQSSSID